MNATTSTEQMGAFNEDEWDDISPIASRAGIEYRAVIDRCFRRRFELLVSNAGGVDGEPLFHLLVPLRFLAARQRSACRLQFTVGKRRLCDEGVHVTVKFVGNAEQGYSFEIRGTLASPPEESLS